MIKLLMFVQCAGFGLTMLFHNRSNTVGETSSQLILHARGLVIEDAQGRTRIIMGAPFPLTKERLRQDPATNSMVFLDDRGHDRLTVGEEPPAQVGGKVSPGYQRIAPGVGILIHDDQGNERGGLGWLSNGRAVLALDRPGLDAVGEYVDDKTGFAGMFVEYAPALANDVNAIEIGTEGKQAFIRLKDRQNKTSVSAITDDGIPQLSGLRHKNK